jgi:hypothetical protein
MLALAVLAMALTMLLRASGANLAATQNAELMAVAAELGRAKLYDIEEQILADGLSEIDLELDGEFDEEGWPKISWEAKVVKIELPNLEAMAGFAGGGEGEEGAQNPLMGMIGMLGLGGIGGATGAEGADAASAAAGAVISSQYELFRTVLEEAIRKITLTVKWKAGRVDRQLVLDLYLTFPNAVTQRARSMGISGGAPGGGQPGTGTGTGTGTNAGTGATRGGSTGRIR